MSKDSYNNRCRRDILKAAGAGVSGFGLVNITTQSTVADDTVTITTAKWGDEPIETRQVPAKWHSQVVSARKAREKLFNLYSNNRWFDSVAQTAAEGAIGDLRKHKIRIYAIQPEVASRKSPNAVESIPVEIQEARKKHRDGHNSDPCGSENNTYNCIPGGARLADSSGAQCFSTGCLVHYNDTPYLLASAHPFGDCGDNIGNSYVYHGGSAEYIGFVDNFNHTMDYALIFLNSTENMDNSIVGESNPVQGHETEWGIDYLISNTKQVRHMGATTGQTTGYVWDKVRNKNCGIAYDAIKTSTNAAGGDSGGPHYNRQSSSATIIGHHEWHTNSDNDLHQYSYCPAAYYLNNQIGITFGGYSQC